MSTATLKLTYFDKRARAEPIRLALTIIGAAFDDERITSIPQWVALKPTTPFGQLPVLTITTPLGSTEIAHSTAILRYVGSMPNSNGPRLYPEDALEAAVVDQIISQCSDFENAFRPSNAEKDMQKKLEMRANLVRDVLSPILLALDKFLAQVGEGKVYCVRDHVTIADLFLCQLVGSYTTVGLGAYDGIPTSLFNEFPRIQKVVNAMTDIPRRKIVIVGDGACGKTCLLIVFVRNEFPEAYVPTVFENHTTSINIEGRSVELTLWDTAGQEDFDRLRTLSYPDTNSVLVTFAIDSPDSLENVHEKWYPEVAQYCPGVPVVLVGLKKDLRHDQAVVAELAKSGASPVSQQQGADMARRIGAVAYMECSARNREGVQEVFQTVTRASLPKQHSGAAPAHANGASSDEGCCTLF
ncbi:hypothetical protein HDU81_011089 [Chytriomyces hyalinus]|nr:hypothetical protein HDU81_011089 [Chytriomyces hyalinus]